MITRFIPSANRRKNEAVYKVVDDYINEEIAGDFIRELVDDPDIAKQLTKDNRNFIQKIYDAIVDFINKLRGKENVRKYQRLADNLRTILEDVTGEEVEHKKTTAPKNNERPEAKQSKTDSEETFKRDKYFDRQIDKWDELDGDKYVTVGTISKTIHCMKWVSRPAMCTLMCPK